MEISPIIVSMKTASVSIVITFFLGLAAAYGVERIRSRRFSDAASCPAAYGGRIFPVVHLWGKTPGGKIFSGIFRNKDCIFMAGNSIGSSGDFVPFDVPFGKRSAAAGR